MTTDTMTLETKDFKLLCSKLAWLAGLAPDVDGHDVWGSAMGVAFACADTLHTRGEDVPDEWQYRPGLWPETHELYEDFSSEYLTLMGGVAVQLADIAERLGLSY